MDYRAAYLALIASNFLQAINPQHRQSFAAGLATLSQEDREEFMRLVLLNLEPSDLN
ncbi:hypothetical protein ACIA2T_19745 [Amycolatopsis japonica]|uniref:hypothetical protein n=1 Tax=Amycolatopsis japonica TaxID=208439 RepID=UPI00379AA13B